MARQKPGLCWGCGELFEGAVYCPNCGQGAARTVAQIETWETKRVLRRVATWENEGLIDAPLAKRIVQRIEKGSPLEAQQPPQTIALEVPAPDDAQHPMERGADALAGGVAAFWEELSSRYSKMAESVESDRSQEQAPSSARTRDESAVEAGRAVFVRGQGAVAPGIESLGELDADDGQSVAKPLGALQVFWFIGTLLVLSGSLMGVREAWRSLEGAWRPLAIAGALFGYHAAFAILARFLARRSVVTGRVLGGIAAALLPVVMVAAAVARGMSPQLGFIAGAALIAASVISLLFVGRVFGDGAGLGLAAGLVPSFVFEIILGAAGVTEQERVELPLIALTPAFIIAIVSRRATTATGIVRSASALAASLYGAIAVVLFAFFGGPDVPALDVASFGTPALAAMAWSAALGTVVWIGMHGENAEETFSAKIPHAASVLAIAALALVLGATCAAAVTTVSVSRFDLFSTGPWVWAPTLIASACVVVFGYEARHRASAIHIAVPVSFVAIALGTNVLSLAPQPFPIAMTAIIPAVLFLSAPWAKTLRRAIVNWAVLTSAGVLFATLFIEYAALQEITEVVMAPCSTAAAVAVALGLSAHLGARPNRTFTHYWGALLFLCASLCYFAPSRPEPFLYWLCVSLVALSVLYAIAALPYGWIVSSVETRPFDDVSLFAALGIAWLCILVVPPLSAVPTTGEQFSDALVLTSLPIAAFFILLWRAMRDKSIVITLHAGLVLAAAAGIIAGAGAPPAFVPGIVALVLVIVASLRAPRPEGAPQNGRVILGFIPLPFGAQGRTLLDGFALAALFLASRAAIGAGGFIGSIAAGQIDTERPFVLFGLIAVIAAGVGAFATKALDVVNARGNVFSLAALGVVIALTALANRIGRPLPPAIVARNLTLVAIAVWIVARILFRFGPKIAQTLERPSHGGYYHYVPHAGVVALGLLLSIDAYFVGAPTITRALVVVPPLFLLGSAIASLLMYRSTKWAPFFHFALASCFGFAMLAGAERALFGPELSPLDPPGGRWVLSSVLIRAREGWLDPSLFLPAGDSEVLQRIRALLGGGMFVLASAGALVVLTRVQAAHRFFVVQLFAGSEETDSKEIKTAFEVWATVAAGLLSIELMMWPAIYPALVLCAAGALAVLASSVVMRAFLPWLGASLLIHAIAHLGTTIPDWAGPAMALLSLATVGGGLYWSRRRKYDVNVLLGTQLIGAALGGIAIVYSLATGALCSQTDAGVVLLINAFSALDGWWATSYSLPITLGVLTISSAIAAWSYRSHLSTILSVSPPLVLSTAAICTAVVMVYRPMSDILPGLVSRNGALTGALVAFAMASAHIAAIVLRWRKHEMARQGTVVGRDLSLFIGVFAMMIFVLGTEPGGESPEKWGVIALGLPLVVAIDSIARFNTARHVYIAQSLVVALYAFITDSMSLRPEFDALLGLAYGFTLLGVAVVARRRKLTTVADATRRFLVVLPIFVALFTMDDLANTTAVFALGSGVLYGTIAIAERSRVFGSLAALAGNLALLVFALAQGLDGIEIYVGPLGLFVMALTQIFSSKLDPSARSSLRVIGGVLLYVPSGLKLALRLGAAEDPTYSVIFGVICLVGVVIGVILRVRAYLALATLALTLDVVANLVYAGLRDHRLGFVLLSVSGLLILALMIGVTLRKERAWTMVSRVRRRLGDWE